MTDPDPSPPKSPAPPPSTEAGDLKAKKEIPVVSIPHEDDMMAEEMAELFEEDRVTHQHGSAEPEGD